MDRFFIPSFASRITSLVLLLAVPSASTIAQERTGDVTAPIIGIGSRVRFIEPSRNGLLRRLGETRTVVGRVTAVDETSITVLPPSGIAEHISRTSAGSLQISIGKQRRVRKGIGTAVAISAFAFLLASMQNMGCTGGPGCGAPSPGDVARVAVPGALLGTVIGIRVARPTDKWAPASWGKAHSRPAQDDGADWHVSPSLDAHGRGVGLSLSVAW